MQLGTLLYALIAGAVGIFIYTKLNSPSRLKAKTYKAPDPNHIPKIKKDKDTVLFSADPEQGRTVFLASRGYGGRPATTVVATLEKAIKKHGNSVAFSWEEKEKGATEYVWRTMTYRDYFEQSKRAARALLKLGLPRYGGVSIIGFNSPEWIISHMGTIMAGGLSAGIYTTNKTDSCKYIVNHSQSAVVVCEDLGQLNKFVKIANEMETVKAIVVYKEKNLEEHKKNFPYPLLTWKEFLDFGTEEEQKVLDERISSQKPSHACSLIYTSGTTGPPKAVMISHDNASWTGGLMKTVLPDWGERPERLVSYLPLSHIAAQLADVYFPLCTAANHKSSATLYFARPDALKGSIAGTLKHVKPTLFFGVPRVWEKFQERMIQVGKKTHPVLQTISQYARKIGLQHWENCQVYGYDYRASITYHLMKLLVFNRVKEAIGLQECRICITGAAPISMETLSYLGSLDIHVHNLYGMSETTGPMTTTRPDFFRAGSAGAPLEGMELKIDHVPGRDKDGEGEICFRGRNVMVGYLRDPVKTKDTFDDDGFFHSGDVGRVDKSTGLLFITGRIKELLITAGGENIAPVPIEEAVLKELPALSNAMLVGDRRKYNAMLVTLKVEVDSNGVPSERLAREALSVSSSSKTVADAKKDPAWKSYIETGIKRYNAQSVSSAQSVQKFQILDRDFSVAGGELTETLKLKRNVVTKMYENVIDGFYADDEGKDDK
eukprot:TRINITY_DN4792_c0_g1_i1.p1 TRINITY_DN4792_c0_g1~~TRINITY_DN4792_c0_g1_i1.p1  ORF type:complete len:718 (+),score=211.67 TRINITY_DN4792_c0_g1_i1:173-2326(+)